MPACGCHHPGSWGDMVFHDDLAIIELESEAEVFEGDLLPIDGLHGRVPQEYLQGGAMAVVAGYGLQKVMIGRSWR